MGGDSMGGDTVSLDDVSCQLRSYGRWLEERSDVELAADDVDLLHDLDGGGSGIARRPRLLAGVAAIAALVVVVVAGLGLSGRAGSGEQLEAGPAGLGGVTPVEEAADTPTSETGTADRPAVGTDDRSDVGQAPTVEDGGPGNGGSGDGAAAPRSGDANDTPTADNGNGDDAQADPATADEDADDEQETTPDNGITPSTVELDDDGKPPWDPANPQVEGAPNFVSPTSGAVLDLNAMNTLRAQPVTGATVYVFEGWQNGVSVMSTSGDEPMLLLPSRLITTGVMGQVQPGPLQLTVSAQDSAGNVLGTSRIDVTVARSGGGATGRDVMGENPFPSN